jgi:hypothetical protein
MRFTSEINGHPVSVDCDHDRISFRCENLDGKFSTAEDLEKAVKAHDLKQRKNFTNPTAYVMSVWRMGSGREVHEVVVTSADDKEAWTTRNGSRSKHYRENIYADKATLEAAMLHEQRLQDEIETVWAAVPRWEPK